MEINKDVLEKHKQLTMYSCIPMAVEFVLKLIDKMPLDDFKHQIEWNDKKDGDFGAFDGKIIEGVKFTRQFTGSRDENFPLKELFNTIDNELNEKRYVLISLQVEGGNYHNYLIYDKINGEYKFTAKGREEDEINLYKHVKAMNGTDILTYKIIDEKR